MDPLGPSRLFYGCLVALLIEALAVLVALSTIAVYQLVRY